DANTGKIIAIVIYNFCKSDPTVQWVMRCLERGVHFKKSVRLEDPGSLVLMGYTAGARSRPYFYWARNVRSKKFDTEMDQFNHESSSVFALFWNLCRAHLPDEIISGIQNFLDTGIPRMDAGGAMATGHAPGTGHYTVQPTPDVSFTFHEAQLAPPTGVFACNYSRAVHYENQPHDYSISWTLARSDPPTAGGNFFISQYGIRVEQAPNTVVVWMPKQPHGTSLQHLDPFDKEPPFLQTGLAFVTSPRILKVWDDFEHKRITKEEALNLLDEKDDVKYE
ncbi:hypothetical protein BDN72DRAFT_778991, partial [Pluteus cervinus]